MPGDWELGLPSRFGCAPRSRRSYEDPWPGYWELLPAAAVEQVAAGIVRHAAVLFPPERNGMLNALVAERPRVVQVDGPVPAAGLASADDLVNIAGRQPAGQVAEVVKQRLAGHDAGRGWRGEQPGEAAFGGVAEAGRDTSPHVGQGPGPVGAGVADVFEHLLPPAGDPAGVAGHVLQSAEAGAGGGLKPGRVEAGFHDAVALGERLVDVLPVGGHPPP